MSELKSIYDPYSDCIFITHDLQYHLYTAIFNIIFVIYLSYLINVCTVN